jgi:hypothetical protein
MKKYIQFFLIMFGSLVFSNEGEVKNRDLCQFIENVFDILQEESSIIDQGKLANAYLSFIERLKQYKKCSNPGVAELAEKFILSFKGGSDNKSTRSCLVSSLGCLIKNSVSNGHSNIEKSHLLCREDLDEQINHIEKKLYDKLPQGMVNYHRLMIDSIADEKYEIALYSYLKIAENIFRDEGNNN